MLLRDAINSSIVFILIFLHLRRLLMLNTLASTINKRQNGKIDILNRPYRGNNYCFFNGNLYMCLTFQENSSIGMVLIFLVFLDESYIFLQLFLTSIIIKQRQERRSAKGGGEQFLVSSTRNYKVDLMVKKVKKKESKPLIKKKGYVDNSSTYKI